MPQPKASAADTGHIDQVRATIESTIAQYPGDWSVYLADLTTGQEVVVNDKPLVAASLIKLYIMLTIFDGFEHGTITDTGDIDSLLEQMITVSSNEAANQLLAVIGNGDANAAIGTVTATANAYGFQGTKELRTLTGMPSGNTVENWTSAQDCGRFLRQAYSGTLVSQAASQRMPRLLQGQTRLNKIPAGLPSGVKTANKTGELAAVQNDAAIVYAEHPYVLAVMSNNVSESAAPQIASLSGIVYEAFETDYPNK